MRKIVQITCGGNAASTKLYALDSDGRVWKMDTVVIDDVSSKDGCVAVLTWLPMPELPDDGMGV